MSNIIDFEKEAKKRGYVKTMTFGEMVKDCDFNQCSSVEIETAGEWIFIEGPMVFGEINPEDILIITQDDEP